ncbi:hypothetical protein Hanom_Chr11g01002341 [Helianthus anomalus]
MFYHKSYSRVRGGEKFEFRNWNLVELVRVRTSYGHERSSKNSGPREATHNRGEFR